jgi:hypothetical protein
MSNIQFTAEDIKSYKFKTENHGYDDNDPLYEGTLTITFMDGTKAEVFLDWVREGHIQDFNKGNKSALITYLNDYEVDVS